MSHFAATAVFIIRKALWTGEGTRNDHMSGFFEDLGRKLGRAAVPTYRKRKWILEGLSGTEGDALESEKALGKTLAAELRLATEILDEPELLHWIRGDLPPLGRSRRPSGFCVSLRIDSG